MKSVLPNTRSAIKFRFRFITAVFICLLLSLSALGCAPNKEQLLKNEIPIGTYEKRYDLYEPVRQLENVACDLYYEYHPSRSLGDMVTFKGYTAGTNKVDIWRIYKLEERENGAFNITYINEKGYPFDESPSGIQIYEQSILLNHNGLNEDRFYTPTDTYIQDNKLLTSPIDSYYCTWVVDGFNYNHEKKYDYYRVWTIRFYVVFIDSDTTITLHEYIFRLKYDCSHDQNGNERWEHFAPIYDSNGMLIDENKHFISPDKYIHDRYETQNYSPSI